MEQQNVTPEKKQRPGILTAFCILSFIWTGLMSLLCLIGILASGWLGSFIENYFPGGGGIIASYFAIVAVVFLVFYVLKLWGAIKMFSMKKSGFILYIIPSALLLIFQLLGISGDPVSLLLLLTSILFIVIYAMNLKHMS
jgi:hypothetical protein